MTHASVFSGIGGPEVAATMLGWENLFHCEINPFGRKVLDYWYPNNKSYEDITTTDFTEWRGRVDVLTGGFPCQPFSYAGRRKGAEDDRYLWPHMHRCINEIQPTWVVAENVAGILTMVEQGEVSKMASQATLFDEGDSLRGYQLRETFTLERICRDVEADGYEVQPILIPACAVGAPHRRDRVFIVARRKEEYTPTDSACGGEGTPRPSGEPESSRCDTHQQPSERRAASERLDRLHAILRPSADPCSGGQSASEQQGERAGQTIQQQGGEQSQHGAGRPSATRLATHPDSHRGCEVDEHLEPELADGAKPVSNGGQRNVADTERERLPQSEHSGQSRLGERLSSWCGCRTLREGAVRSEAEGICGERWQNFPSVSPIHRGNDGIPFDVDCLAVPPIPEPPTYGKGNPKKYPFSKWRTEALKAYGNAIVPQVMYEIFRAIEIVEQR